MTTEWTRGKVVNELREIVAEEGDISIGIVSEESRLQADLGFDSLTVVETMMAVEDDFEIEFPETDEAGDPPVGDIADVIFDRLVQKESDGA